MGHDPEAIEQFQRALKLDRATPPRCRGSRARERLAILSPPKPAEPPPPKIVDEAGARERYTAAVKMINDRKYAESLPILDQALEKKPGYGVALVARARRTWAAAVRRCRRGLHGCARRGSVARSPLFGLAEAYRALGQSAKAAEFYREYAASTRRTCSRNFGLCGAQCAGARKSLNFPERVAEQRVRRRKHCAAAGRGLCLGAQP